MGCLWVVHFFRNSGQEKSKRVNTISYKMDLHALIGFWEVKCFVSPTDLSRRLYPSGTVPKELQGKIYRNEVLRVVETSERSVLFACYEHRDCGSFWILKNKKTGKVGIRTMTEIRKPVSYELVSNTKQSNSSKKYWSSCRDTACEPHHVIQWNQKVLNNVPKSLKNISVPTVPSRFSRKSVKQCQCGILDCMVGINGGSAH